MVVGDDARLRVRVDIDENDAGRVDRPRGGRLVRGNPELRSDLRFESIEPYVAPKKSLSGDTTERADLARAAGHLQLRAATRCRCTSDSTWTCSSRRPHPGLRAERPQAPMLSIA